MVIETIGIVQYPKQKLRLVYVQKWLQPRRLEHRSGGPQSSVDKVLLRQPHRQQSGQSLIGGDPPAFDERITRNQNSPPLLQNLRARKVPQAVFVHRKRHRAGRRRKLSGYNWRENDDGMVPRFPDRGGSSYR